MPAAEQGWAQQPRWGLTFIFSLAGTNFVGPSIADHTQRDTLCGKKYNKKIIPFMCMYGVNNTGCMNFGKTPAVKRSEPVEGVAGERMLETSNFGPYPSRETVDRDCPGWKMGVLHAGTVMTEHHRNKALEVQVFRRNQEVLRTYLHPGRFRSGEFAMLHWAPGQ